MRLIMLGNGPFAVPTLQALFASRHELKCAVVRPPRAGRGRHRNPPPSPLHQAASELGVEVLAPKTVNDDDVRGQLADLNPDLCVVCDYGEILKPETIDLPRLGTINLHGSLLPKYRGAAPVAWAIYHGETGTGNTVFQLTAGVDAGPILGQHATTIGPEETAEDVEARLAEQGASLVVDVVDQLDRGVSKSIEQKPSAATKAPRLKKSDGQIDWSRSAVDIRNQVRAMWPWPKAFTEWQRPSNDTLRMIITRAALVDLSSDENLEEADGVKLKTGAVLKADHKLIVATGNGAIEILSLQPAGKRVMSAEDFMRGHAIRPGEQFGS